MNEDRVKSFFLVGAAVLGILIVGGLIWAVAAGPQGAGGAETGLHFTDDNDPATGPAEAKTVVRMFSDFQCPACRGAEPGVKYALEKYGKVVRFIWNDFPLVTIHKNAMQAAQAARCAEEQGKFWEYRDMLFAQQTRWENLGDPNPSFTDYAKALSLRESSFTACLANKTYDNKIRDDMAEGDANRVNATPTFFINNVRRVGAMTNAEWDQFLQAALAPTASSTSGS